MLTKPALCAAVAIVLAVATLFVFGISIWTAAMTAILLGCPVAVAWAYFATEKDLRSLPTRRIIDGGEPR